MVSPLAFVTLWIKVLHIGRLHNAYNDLFHCLSFLYLYVLPRSTPWKDHNFANSNPKNFRTTYKISRQQP